jgi:hypothetical protein
VSRSALRWCGGVVPTPVLIEATIFDATACGMCRCASKAFAFDRVAPREVDQEDLTPPPREQEAAGDRAD